MPRGVLEGYVDITHNNGERMSPVFNQSVKISEISKSIEDHQASIIFNHHQRAGNITHLLPLYTKKAECTTLLMGDLVDSCMKLVGKC